MSSTIGAANDDVACEGIARAKRAIGIRSSAGEDPSCGVVGDLGACDSSRSCDQDEGCEGLHFVVCDERMFGVLLGLVEVCVYIGVNDCVFV